VVRRSYRVAEIRSKRQRRAQETALLDREGHRIVVYELQGDLSFPSLESLSRRVIQDLDSAECFILDARRMLWLDAVAGEILRRLAERLRAHGRRLIICELPPSVAGVMLEEVVGAEVSADLDATLEAAEDALLQRLAGPDVAEENELDLAELDILSRLAPADLGLLRPYLVSGSYRAGEPIVTEGEPADRLYFITRGRAEISVAVGAGRRRLGTIEAGNLFGELALFSGGRRTADVVALGEVSCCVLARADLDRLGQTSPRLQIELLTLVGQALAERLRRANAEIRALSQ
jgi:glutaminase